MAEEKLVHKTCKCREGRRALKNEVRGVWLGASPQLLASILECWVESSISSPFPWELPNSTSKKDHQSRLPREGQEGSHRLFKLPPQRTNKWSFRFFMVSLVLYSLLCVFLEGHRGALASIKLGFLLIWSDLDYCVGQASY